MLTCSVSVSGEDERGLEEHCALDSGVIKSYDLDH